MFKEITNKLTSCMVWFLTLSVSFLITTMGILLATYAYVIFHSKYTNSKFSMGNISAELSSFQQQIDAAISTNGALIVQNNQLLEKIKQFPELMAGNNFDSARSITKDEINKLKKLLQSQSDLLESQKSDLNLLNHDLSKLNAKDSKQGDE